MDKIKDAFYQVYVGEAKAALRLKAYARKARDEGYHPIANLFRVIARSEEIHGIRALEKLEAIKGTEENLESSFQSETSVAAVAYQKFQKTALEAGKESAALIFSQAHDVEETHSRLYRNAMDHMLENREVNYYICEICGYIAENHCPDTCPVCNAKKDRFTKA
jgi:rubrerythrin